MYYRLVSALKRRLILELQDVFSRHPVYDKLVPNIQDKNTFSEAPQYGLVVKGSSTNKIQLSSDNFVGHVHSYVMLTYLKTPAYMLEWVREDLSVIENAGGMPSQPGVYYLECLKAPTNANEEGSFAIDPLYTVLDEPLMLFATGTEQFAQLEKLPVKDTVRLWENGNYPLKEGVDYEIDYASGEVQFKTRFAPHARVTADYFNEGVSIGPIPFRWNSANSKVIPGVVLAFGKRARVGDKLAVQITPEREDTAMAYGGKFEVNFELDVISRDTIQMEEIADFAVMSLWGEKKNRLELEGIEIIDVSMGGETEESYDETGDLWYYNASLSVQLRADWEVHIPMPLRIYKASITSVDAENSVTADRRTDAKNNLVALAQPGLYIATAPILVNRNDDYERIS